MRKHSTHLTRRHLAAVTIITLGLAACGRDARERVADSAIAAPVVAGMRDTRARELSVARRATITEAKAFATDGAAASAPAEAPAPAPSNQSGALVETGSPLPPASDPAGAMLVRHGEASLEVGHVDDAISKMRQTAQQFGGFVANTAVRNGKDEQPSATLEIRVPTAQFDGLLGALRTFGKVESVTASAEDVGEEYVDLGARAANARRVEARLVELLATRTGKLSDVLTVEQELSRVRQEIERHDARLRWLERRASLSALTVAVHQKLSPIDRPNPGPIVEAIALAWERTLSVIAWCIASLGLIVPLALLAALVAMVVRRTLRRPPGEDGPTRRPSVAAEG